MLRAGFRVLLLVVVICAEILLVRPVAEARGADPCPEPNDSFQAACYLGTGSDALGFISAREDVDAYRFEVLDFGVQARLELADMPAAYRLHLADWNGTVVAESSDQGGVAVLEYTLGPPGSYYVFVDSATGAASDTAPYRLTTKLTYAGAIPQASYANEFRSNTAGLCNGGYYELPSAHSPGFPECLAKDGRFSISYPGQESARQSSSWSYWGSEHSDFTLIVDMRVSRQTSGFDSLLVLFRVSRIGEYNDYDGYMLSLVPHIRELRVRRTLKGTPEYRQDLLQLGANNIPENVPVEQTGVNRLVVRAVGSSFTFNINGVEVAQAENADIRAGVFGFGALSTSQPPLPTSHFDNALITTP